MQRFFVPLSALRGQAVLFPEETTRQIHHVLRLKPGDRVMVLDNTGWEYEVVLQVVVPKKAEAEIVGRRLNAREPVLRLVVYQCLLKSDHFEWVLQKGTELGVSGFIPVLSQRTIVGRSGEVKENKFERWRRIITEAAEQSGRGRLPFLGEVTSLDAATAGLDPQALSVIPWEEQPERGLASLLAGRGGLEQAAVNLFIGPEGGFSSEEIRSAEERGVLPVTLGARILRAETASVVAAALILSAAGEMG